MNKYFIIIYFIFFYFNLTLSGIQLNDEEKKWLNLHPVITVTQDPGWPPIEFINSKGEFQGISSDYLNIIEQKLGIKFKRIQGTSWQESYQKLKNWEIDMTTSVAVTPEREKFWVFTKPYIKVPIVIISHSNVTYISNMRELFGKKVAIVEGYAVDDWIPRDYPEINLVKVKNVKEGFEYLQKGKVFAFIDNMLVLSYYITKLKIMNVKIVGETPYTNTQSMAIRKDWVIFAGIIQKALDTIPESKKNSIYYNWVPVRYEHGFNYQLLWQILAVFIVIIIILILWIHKLLIEIRRRKKAELDLRHSDERFYKAFHFNPNAIIMIQMDEENIIDANESFIEISGLSFEEIIGQNINKLELINFSKIKTDILKKLNENEIILNFETILITRYNEIKNVLLSFVKVNLKDKECILLQIHDITIQKNNENQLKKSLEEKEILLRELYHRTKNNMQIISSLLSLKATNIKNEDSRLLFKDMENRIKSMALVHQKLYQSQNLSKINLKEYIIDLVGQLQISYNMFEIIKIIYDITEIFVSIDIAIPCGLIINELITNSFKYAFPEKSKGEIRIHLSKSDVNCVKLIISDNGIGVEKDFNFRSSDSFGIQNIFLLIEKQLNGEVNVKNGNGLHWEIKFSDNLYNDRII